MFRVICIYTYILIRGDSLKNRLVAHLENHYSVYSVSEAAAILCGLPESEITTDDTDFESAVFVIKRAIEYGHLKTLGGHGNKIISRDDFRKWVIDSYPPELVPTLFDKQECLDMRANGPDRLNELRVENEDLKIELKASESRLIEALANNGVTINRILGAVLGIVSEHSRKDLNQAALVRQIEARFPNVSGLSRRTVEKYFALSKKALPQTSRTEKQYRKNNATRQRHKNRRVAGSNRR